MRWNRRILFRLPILAALITIGIHSGCELVEPPGASLRDADGLGVQLIYPPSDTWDGDKAPTPDSLRIRLFRLGDASSSQFTERPAFDDTSAVVAVDVAGDESVVLEIGAEDRTTFWRVFIEADSLLGQTTFPIEPTELQRSVRVVLADTTLADQDGNAVTLYPGFPAEALSEPSGSDPDGSTMVYPVRLANLQTLIGLDLRFALPGADVATTEVEVLLDPGCRLFRNAQSGDQAALDPQLTDLDFPGNPPAYRLQFSKPGAPDPDATLDPGSEILFYVVARGSSLPATLCIDDASAFGFTFPDSSRVLLDAFDGQQQCGFAPVGVAVADPAGDLVPGAQATLFFDVQESWGDSALVELVNDQSTEPCLTIARVATDATSVIWSEVDQGRCAELVDGFRIRVTDLETGIGAVNPNAFSIVTPLPDLLINSLSVSIPNPDTNDEIVFTAVVGNFGSLAAGASSLELAVGDDAATFAVPALAPGETHQVSRTLVLATAGTYTVTATADLLAEIVESNENNNDAATTVTVQGEVLLPDLVVESLTHAPDAPDTDDEITITAVVRNAGAVAAGPSGLRLAVGEDGVTFAVPSLAPGATHPVTRTLTLATAGNYPVTATADPQGLIAETDETNNALAISMPVGDVAPLLPDLVIESFAYEPQQPDTDDLITFSAVVRNAGDGPAAASQATIAVGDDVLALAVPALAAGGTHEVTRQLTLESAGTYQVTASADAGGNVVETDETNNDAATTVTVGAAPSDLVIQGLTFVPDLPYTEEVITLTATVANVGNGPAAASQASIAVGEDAASFPVPALAPGETHQVTREMTVGTAGEYTATATADAAAAIDETDETNNTYSTTLIVIDAPPPPPDLVVESLGYDPQQPDTDDLITFSAVVRNAGDGPAAASHVEIAVGEDAVSLAVPALPAGATSLVTRELTLASPGEYAVTATADVLGEVTETDETNNDAATTVTVIDAPADLVVQSLGYDPPQPDTDDVITFTAVIENVGNGPAAATQASIAVGEDAASFPVPALAPGETHQVTRELTLDTAGEYTVTATADALGEVAETDETNNDAAATVTVIEAPPDLVIQSLSYIPEAPDTDDVITISAVVENAGNGPAAASHAEIAVGEDAVTFPVPALPAGATSLVTRELTLAAPGEYAVTATADVLGEVAETDETNNAEGTTVIVAPAPADLVIQSLSYLPETPNTTDEITFTVVVENAGGGPASTASQLRIAVGEDSATFPVPPLAPGATHESNWLLTLDTPGEYTVTATADALGQIPESDETNNEDSTSLTVLLPPADLIIDSLGYAPADPDTQDPIDFTIVVRNVGFGPAGPSQLAFTVDEFSGTFPVPPLPANGTHQVVRQQILSSPGEYVATATADVTDAVFETDETNNDASVTVTVVDAPPDLTIQSLSYLPATPDTDDLITFTAVVRNLGAGPAPPSAVEISVGEDAQLVPVPALPPGGTYPADRQLVLGNADLYYVAATADAPGAIAESDEENNYAFTEVYVNLAGDALDHAVFVPIPFDTTGTTVGFSDDYDEVCPYAGSTSPDVVYTFVPGSSLEITVDLYGSSYDTKVYIYDEQLNLIACNDDYYEDYTSLLANVPVLGGVRYYLVVDGYGGESGVYSLQIADASPCVIDCAGDAYEGEPPLDYEYIDDWNGGCNTSMVEPVYQLIGVGTFCGVSGYYLVDGVETRDTDWFQVAIPASGVLAIVGDAEQPSYMYELSSGDCATYTVDQIVPMGSCAAETMYVQGEPGSWAWIWVGPQVFASPDGLDVQEFAYVLDIGDGSGPVAVKSRRTKPGFVAELGTQRSQPRK